MAIEEGESSSKVVVLRTKTVIKKVKDNNRDIVAKLGSDAPCAVLAPGHVL
jgi:hypothetical protein